MTLYKTTVCDYETILPLIILNGFQRPTCEKQQSLNSWQLMKGNKNTVP